LTDSTHRTLLAVCLTAIFTQKPTSLGFRLQSRRQSDKVERMIECLLALFECQARSEKRGAFCSLTFTFCISNLLWKPGMQIMGLKWLSTL